jgi:hypothetical protein
MAKTPSSNIVRKAGSKAKSTKTSAQPGSAGHSPAIEGAARLDEDRIRERAYGIWIAEGRPHGREVAHWQRAHHELQRGSVTPPTALRLGSRRGQDPGQPDVGLSSTKA